MSQLSQGILSTAVFGTIAIALSFGAVQLASGRDLATPQDPGASAAAVNRAAKADRAAGMAGLAVLTQTIALRLEGLSDTSVLVRVPLAHEARNNPASSRAKSGDRPVACEPSVSILTEAFKLLPPGRCVT